MARNPVPISGTAQLGSILRRVRRLYYRRRAARAFRGIPRTRRERCWCGGDLLPFQWHQSYGVCSICGSYTNRRPLSLEGLTRLYALNSYWVLRQRAHGFPSIESRAELYLRDGRVDSWVKLIEKYAPEKSRVIEVGCAPGICLKVLAERNWMCLGVEPSEDTAAWIRARYRVDVKTGLFPALELPKCGLFLAFDVLEHSYDPGRFMKKVADLLTPGGVAIIQTAIDRYSYVPPFSDRFADAFDDLEHLFLFTDGGMRELAIHSGLDVVSLEERLWVLGEVAVFRKPVQCHSRSIERVDV
jgi:SAM-dependent methyltransferase